MRHMRNLVFVAGCLIAYTVVPHAPAAPARAPESPAPAAATGDQITIPLGGQADQVRSGGSGRYLIFHLKDSDKLTVVDVVARKLLKSIPAPGDFQYAANRDKLLIVLNSQRIIQRWDLKTQEREKAVILVDDKPIRLVAMGSSGNGPLAVWPEGKLQFWDTNTLKPLAIRGEVVDAGNGSLWPSADGLTFCAWGWTSGPYQLMRLSGLTPTSVDCALTPTPEAESYNESWAMPSADGSLLVKHGAGFYDREMAKVEAGPLNESAVYPTEDPRFLIALRRVNDGNTASIVAAADLRVLYTVRNFEPVTGAQMVTQLGRLGPEPRVHYLPGEKLLIAIPDSNDKVVVRDFDLEKTLKALDADYLFVTSKPPTRIPAGAPYSYSIETLSKAGGVKFRIEDGPKGLAVSDKGLVTWQPDASISGRVGVIIAVSDASGQETMHSIVLNVTKEAPPAVAVNDPASKAPDRPERDRLPAAPAIKASPAVVAQLKGVWTATPPLDEGKIRAAMTKRGVPPEKLDAAVAKYVGSLSGFRVVYAFNEDGSVVRSFGTDAEPHATAAQWELINETSAKELQIRVRASDGAKSEELKLRFNAPDRFEATLLSSVLSAHTPMVFSRGNGPAPVVTAPVAKAEGAAPATQPVDPKVAQELARIGKNIAADLDQEAQDELGQDPGPIVRISASYALDTVGFTREGARIVIGSTEVTQRSSGGPTMDVNSQTVFDLRRENDKWVCARATKIIHFNDPERRTMVDVTGKVRRVVDAAQGMKVQKAQTLNEGDQPIPGEADERLKSLAARLARDVQAGMRADQMQFPDARGVNVGVVEVRKTKNGVSITLSMRSELVEPPGRFGGPTEFVDTNSHVNVTLRAVEGGKWYCVRATSKLDSITSRHGPLNDQPGPEIDITADLQDWLDGPPKASPPRKSRPPGARSTTAPASH